MEKRGSPGDADLLAHVPLLAQLPARARARIAAEARVVCLRPGDELFRAGDEATDAFVVRSGRLAVLTGSDPAEVIRIVKRGGVIGELALLHGGARSASVVAGRASELIAIGHEQFGLLLRDEPAFAVALARMLGAQMAAQLTPQQAADPPRTVAVIGLEEGAPAARVAERLAAGLRAHGSTVVLRPGPDGRPVLDHPEMLAQAECEHDRVVLAHGAPRPDDPWTAACLSDGDVVVAVSRGEPDPVWDACATLEGCELMVVGDGATASVLGGRIGARETVAVRDTAALDAATAACARRIGGDAVGIVFSGGGARAFAHLGVVEELLRAGVRVDRVGGVSFGALVGATVARGDDPAAVAERFTALAGRARLTGDLTLPAYSLIRGNRARGLLAEIFGDLHFEDLPRRLFCASADVNARRLVVHRSGLVREAVFTSVALPGVFPPTPTSDGGLLVDGGVLDNLPVAAMASRSEGPVIAVDVTGSAGATAHRHRPSPLAARVRRLISGQDAELPRLADTLLRTLTAGSIDTVRAARRHADLVITPRVDGIGRLDWRGMGRAREAGAESVRRLLEADPAALDRFRG